MVLAAIPNQLGPPGKPSIENANKAQIVAMVGSIQSQSELDPCLFIGTDVIHRSDLC